MNRHGDLLAPAKQLKRRRLRRRLFGLGLLMALLIVGSIWFINQERWLIQNIVVEGNDLVPTGALTETAGTVLAGRWWGLFSRRHILWYPKETLFTALYQTFPRLAAVSSAIDYPNLRLSAVERQPVAIWCPLATITQVSAGNLDFCYFIDETGTVFSLAPRFSSPVFFTLVSDWGEVSPVGEVPIPAPEVESLLLFQQQLRQLFPASLLADFQPAQAEPLGAGDYNLLATRYRAGVLESLIIKVNVHRDFTDTVPLLAAVLSSSEVIAEITAAGHLPRVFDLRFPGKVFYRFEFEAEAPVIEEPIVQPQP